MKENCPLCDSKNIVLIDHLNKNTLVNAYQKMTKQDFSGIVNEDISYCKCNNCNLKFFSPLVTGNEEFYNSLQHLPWYYVDEKEEYLHAKNFISPTDKILDVGCGKGAFARHLNKNNYTGLDFSTNAKEMAAKNSITIENVSIQDYAKKHPESFDIVCSFQVLEHISDPNSFIENKILALKKGGKLIISVPSHSSFLKYTVNSILDMPPHHVTHWNDEALKFIASKYDLEIIDFHHEKLQDVHKAWFVSTMIQTSILKPTLMDYSFSRIIVNIISTLLTKFLKNGLKSEMLPNGHSVTVVYRKK